MTIWVQLTEDIAKTHPNYGIKKGAAFLRFILVATPAMWCFSSAGNLQTIGQARGGFETSDYLTILAPVIFFIWSLWNASILGKHDPRFFKSFYAFVVIGPVILIVCSLLWMVISGLKFSGEDFAAKTIGTLLGWFLWFGLAAAYVHWSTRINVTLRHVVKSNDLLAK
jgi:hypothetical protein